MSEGAREWMSRPWGSLHQSLLEGRVTPTCDRGRDIFDGCSVPAYPSTQGRVFHSGDDAWSRVIRMVWRGDLAFSYIVGHRWGKSLLGDLWGVRGKALDSSDPYAQGAKTCGKFQWVTQWVFKIGSLGAEICIGIVRLNVSYDARKQSAGKGAKTRNTGM